MPFVFVHGVNNRQNTEYDREKRLRQNFLQQIVAPVVGIDPTQNIYSPYWGGDGVNFWRNLEVVPRGSEIETFGDNGNVLSPSLGIGVADGIVLNNDTFDALARRNPDVAIDILFDSIIQEAQSETDIHIVAKAYQLAQARLANFAVPWLADCSSENLLDQIFDVISPLRSDDQDETLGGSSLWSMLEEGASRLLLLGPDQLAHAVVAVSREPLTRKIATFIGDACRYLAERGDGTTPGPIAQTVLESLFEASAQAREKDEPLVVISHSFGGEIVYDILTHYAKDSDLKVDVWVTVGSQVGLFEEMSLLWTSPGRTDRAAIPREAIASPESVKHWLNIIDTNDVLGFLILPTFTGVTPATVNDFKYNTGFPVAGAHSGYFKWPSFYKRLAQRIKESLN